MEGSALQPLSSNGGDASVELRRLTHPDPGLSAGSNVRPRSHSPFLITHPLPSFDAVTVILAPRLRSLFLPGHVHHSVLLSSSFSLFLPVALVWCFSPGSFGLELISAIVPIQHSLNNIPDLLAKDSKHSLLLIPSLNTNSIPNPFELSLLSTTSTLPHPSPGSICLSPLRIAASHRLLS
ncbi:hypothetical protein B0T20DRAFT_229999 [Sordaria brevicollis]|uniref:Uncharacterized protein n=1 Tax=Sordaria brevicollis TaxID=83679 RepID=A0AAE0PD19_SORBR|nr:hypothetical protein B0T20DRAFT_229999 [Sordaria brevicollis]